MSVEATVVCDGCGHIGDARKTAAKARAGLRKQGWRTALPGGRDLCSRCVAAQRPPAELPRGVA